MKNLLDLLYGMGLELLYSNSVVRGRGLPKENSYSYEMEGKDKMHPALFNGHVRCTLIESFSGEVSVVRPGFKKEFGKGLPEAKKFIDDQGWEISVFIIKGSLILRKMMTYDQC